MREGVFGEVEVGVDVCIEGVDPLVSADILLDGSQTYE